jgi:protein arginine N-methyltransferase 7
MYICYSNAAAASLSIHHYDQALQYAETCRILAESALKKNTKAFPTYIKSFLRKGQALQGLLRHREAVNIFNQALKLDPYNIELKLGLESANQAVLADLVEGKNTEKRAITYPDKSSQRITYHPHSAPLHRIRNDDMLPLRLLTPFQAENDHNIKDTYNYLTIQSDIRMPKRQIEVVKDDVWQSAWATAIHNAVREIRYGGGGGGSGKDKEDEEEEEEEEIDCRVLNLGAGAGLHAALALKSGAHHVTAVERWLYLALTAQETLSRVSSSSNGSREEKEEEITRSATTTHHDDDHHHHNSRSCTKDQLIS